MSKLDIRPLQEIVKEAISQIENPYIFSFSEYVNAIERKAHEIYLDEEKKAIEHVLLEKFGPTSVLGNILKGLVNLIQELSTIIANTRRARGGGSSEYILKEALFRYANIKSEVIGRQQGEGSYYPDLAIPSRISLTENKHKSIALAVKRTLRERWREDVAIFNYFPNSAFVCISEDTDISNRKLKDMESEGIGVLFIPDLIYKKHENFISSNIKKMKVYKLSYLPVWITTILS